MCGIFGYVGDSPAEPILIQGLKDLEYRGYDSAGFFIAPSTVLKMVGPVANLDEEAKKHTILGTVGIAHTRWATHGQPSEANCHPHSGGSSVWLVHNGIIENYLELKQNLLKEGHLFTSETDSEVLAHLIQKFMNEEGNLVKSVAQATKLVRGTYGIAVMDVNNPSEVVVARMGSPIALGVGDNENFIASDPSALVNHTKRVIYLDDGEIAVVKKDSYSISTINHQPISREPELIDWDVEMAQKGGYAHFMLKEIMESPSVIENSSRGRLVIDLGDVKLGGLEDVNSQLQNMQRLVIVGCGSAYYAGLAGKYMLEEYANIPVEVEIGSEFRYKPMLYGPNTVLLVISQSGETADTLASLRRAKDHGLLTLGIVNTVGSTMARETDAGIYNHAGAEIGVASTKAFISQLEVLALLTVFLGRQRNMTTPRSSEIIQAISKLPDLIKQILIDQSQIQQIAAKYINYRDFLFIGRKVHYPIALEGALKLKEVSYVHAEGYGAGEMKHGPLAMIDDQFPTIALAPNDEVYEKMISNIEEIKARQGEVVLITTNDNQKAHEITSDVIYIPKSHPILQPILTMIPLQLLAYYIGIGKEFNVDRPRNLAKSVTVE